MNQALEDTSENLLTRDYYAVTCVCGECEKCRQRAHKRYHRLGKKAPPKYAAIECAYHLCSTVFHPRTKQTRFCGARCRQREKARRVYNNAGPELKAKISARQAARRAASRGHIPKGPCEVCGALSVEAHHDDYSKPLEVRWLCRAHHAAHHREHGEAPLG
jgi:hypothetical protein